MSSETLESQNQHACPADGCTESFETPEQLSGHVNAKAPYDDEHAAVSDAQPAPDHNPAKKLQEDRRGTISSAECRAMRILTRDGWSQGELKMTFQLCRLTGVRYHIYGHCSHGHNEPSLREPRS